MFLMLSIALSLMHISPRLDPASAIAPAMQLLKSSCPPLGCEI
jgi:hypothetical protein